MKTRAVCPACHTKIMVSSSATPTCPACGAGLKKKGNRGQYEVNEEAPRPAQKSKKKRKKKRSGPNYPLIGGIGGGVVVLGAVAVIAVVTMQGFRRPVGDSNRPEALAGTPGQPAPGLIAGPTWNAKADPPKTPIRAKDDLSIPIEGEPLFASGSSPFVADLVPVIVGRDNPPVLSVYDVTTGQKALTAKAINYAQTTTHPEGTYFVALGPEGKTLAVWATSRTGSGRKAVTTSEVLIYKLGKDELVAKIPAAQHLSWLAFGKDENQLIVVSAPAGMGFSAMAYDLSQKEQAENQPGHAMLGLQVTRSGNRWRNGFGRPESLVVSPGRNYLAVGEGRSVELIQLSDGKLAGTCPLPGDCITVAFSADGKELIAHSQNAPPRRTAGVPTNYQWTTFSLEDGKQLTQEVVSGGPNSGAVLAAGPKPGLAVHGDKDQVVVTDTRLNAPAYSMPFHAIRSLENGGLLGYDTKAKQVVVRRIDADELAAGEKKLAEIFGPRPKPDNADRAALAAPAAPDGWSAPIDATDATVPELVGQFSVKGGADFVMPWHGSSMLSAVIVKKVATPRDRYALQWQRIDMKSGTGAEPVELWPSLLPPGEVPPLAGHGSVVAAHTADGSRLALKDAATPARVDVWDSTGKRIAGFVPYGPETPVDSLAWTADNRLITMGGNQVTAWEVPGPKAIVELKGYSGAYALSPTRKWIAVQTDKFIDVFETATGKPLGRMVHGNPSNKPWHALTVSTDGTQLAAVELAQSGYNEARGVWAVGTWDLKTGVMQKADRLFAGLGNRHGHHLMWLAPRLLLAGGVDVIDLDARTVIATFTLNPPHPLPSPDGRYWGARSDMPAFTANQPRPLETIVATRLERAVQTLHRPAFDDVVLREGGSIDVVSSTGDSKRDAVIRSQLRQLLTSQGYGTVEGAWKLTVSGNRVIGSGSLETPDGGKIQIPSIKGKIELLDPTGTVAWESSHSGGWDRYQTKYKTSTEQVGGPGGGSITHYHFGLRDPQDAMADEAWDNFVEGLKSGARFPRVIARVNGKLTPLPIAVTVNP